MSSADQLALAVERALVRIRAAAHLKETGRERIDMWLGDRAELDVIERRDELRRLDALLGRRVLQRRLGTVTTALRADFALLDSEARPLRRDFDLSDYTRSSTSTVMLKAARDRRWARARNVARTLSAADGARHAYDASNNDLLPLFFLRRNEDARVRLLADALVQFRALRRSPALVDAKDRPHEDDNSQGRLTTSGLLASLEQALVCQRVATTMSERERALTRLCVVHAPHLAPSTIYEACNLTLELLGRDDRGLQLLGRGFERVYGAIHTLYSADTPSIVHRFVVDNLCAGLPEEQALARLRAAVEDDERVFLRAHCRLPGLARARADVQRATYERLLRLHATVCTSAPSLATVARDAGFARAATPHVLLLLDAARPRDIIERAAKARDAIARVFEDTSSGAHRARMWRLDRDIEHLLVRALGDLLSSSRDRARAARLAARAVVQSGLHALASPETARAFLRAQGFRALHEAAARVADEVRAFFHERERAIHFAGVRVLLDPRFVDRLVKESALHPLLELSHRSQATAAGVRVIATPSARSFRVHLMRRALRPSEDLPDVACVAFAERHAPPGYSHASVLARERGTGLLVVDDLSRVPRGVVHLDNGVLRPGAGRARRAVGGESQARLFAPDLTGAPTPVTMRQLALLPLDRRRAIAGEKAAVLSELLRSGVASTIDGVVVPFALVAQWVRHAGLFDAWMRGALSERRLRALTPTQLFLPTRAWPLIARSSGSAEDRPYKSDAGVALSVGGVRSARALQKALGDVVAATWSKRSLAAQERAGVAMRDVWPAIIVQRDLSSHTQLSGVAISRGKDGALGAISYQCVRGAGGAVRGARGAQGVEEGHVSPVEHVVTRGPALLSNARARVLGQTVLAIERLFFDVIEPRAGHAVDVEWLWTKRGLVVVQARTLAR